MRPAAALTNPDLAPTPVAQRTWTTYDMASLWVGLSVCIPTYMLAAGLVGAGMNWKQAVFTVFLGNLIVCIPMVLVAHAGTKYGIPFPIVARAAFGVRGSNVPAIMRGLVGCGWFGIQTWIGGEAIAALIRIVIPGWHAASGSAIGFVLFWILNIWIVARGSTAIRRLEDWSAPILIVSGLALLAWAVHRAGGFGPVLAQPGRLNSTAEFLAVFVPSLTAMVGFWATMAINIPDLSRYARSQRAQVWGQLLGLPTTMTLFAFIGVAVTSASVLIFGDVIWDPVQLLSRVQNPALEAVALVIVLLATLTTNVAANVVAPANSLANLWPSHISFARGGVIAGIAGVLLMPWRLVANADRYFGWLVAYSALLGPIAGVLIADYWLVRRGQLDVPELYAADGRYGQWRGRAFIALAAGILVALAGLVIPPLRWLYDYAWFAGFFVAALVHVSLNLEP